MSRSMPRRLPLAVLTLAASGLVLSLAACPTSSAGLHQDVTYECEWRSGPRLPAKVQLAAGAMDHNENVLYVYGG